MRLSTRASTMRSSEIRDLLRLTERPGLVSLAGGLPDPSGFPAGELAEEAAALLRSSPSDPLQYSSTEGVPALREWLAARHTQATGRPTSPDQVLVTTGSQQGLDLLTRVLADPGDVAAVEHPAYLGALQALRAGGLELAGIALDGEGLSVEHLAAELTAGVVPRLVYVVPTFQNPTGTTLPEARRHTLAELAERHQFVVVEDEPYAALRFRGEPPAPVAAHSDRVVSLGTFSKTLAPGLRLGWVIGPPDVISAAARAKQAVDLHTSALSQHLALRLVDRPGWFDDHVERLRERYRQRAHALRTAMTARLGDRLAFTDPDGGMFLWGTPHEPDDPLDTTALLPVAVEHGTAFVPGSAFSARPADPALSGAMRLSFATASPDELATAAERLAAAVAQTERRLPPRMRRGPRSQVR